LDHIRLISSQTGQLVYWSIADDVVTENEASVKNTGTHWKHICNKFQYTPRIL